MGSKLITSYAALGVGLAVVLTFGLGAISSVTEQPSENQYVAQTGMMKNIPEEPVQEAGEAEKSAEIHASAPAAAPPTSSTTAAPSAEQHYAMPAPTAPAMEAEEKEDVNATVADVVKPSMSNATYGGTETTLVQEGGPASTEETSREGYSIAAEVPPSPLAPVAVILPYIAAAVAGSVVFVVTRKRVGW